MEIQSTTSVMKSPAGVRTPDRPAPAGDVSVSQDVAAPTGGDSVERLRDAVASINRELLLSGRELSFSVDEASGKTVFRVLHSTTGEVVRQVPDETVLAVAARLQAGASLDSLGYEWWA